MADIISQQGLYQDGNSIFENVHILGTLEVTGIVKSETNLTSTGSITASKFIGDGSELSGIDATTIKDSAGTTQIQGTTTGATHSGKAVFDELEIGGKLYDGDGDFGTSGQVLASDGTNTNWVNTGSLTAGAASEVGVTAVNTDSDHFIAFVDSSSGNENVKVDTNLTYNPSSNTFGSTNIATLYVTGNLRLGGELRDGANAFGTSGQVLSSDGTDTAWVNAGSLTAGAAAEVGVTATNTTDSTHFPVFVEASSGNEEVRVDTGFSYNPFSGTLTATTFSGGFSGGDGVFNDLTVNGELKDGAGNFGSTGQVLSSDGTDTAWVNAGSLTAGAAAEVGVNQTNTTDSTHFPVFVEASSGNEEVRVDTGFTYNPNSGTLTATSFVGSGANLTGITQTVINNNAANRVITGSATANTLNAESGLTYNGTTLQLAAADDIRIAGGTWTGEYTGGIKIQPDASNSYFQYHGGMYFRNSGGANRVYFDSAGNTTIVGNLTVNGGISGSGASLTGVNATTLDSIDSGSFLRSDADDTATGRIVFTKNDVSNYDTIATSTGSQGAIEIYNGGAGNDAFMTFHTGGDYALYFGLDADNNSLSVGGWSMGANKYKIWHEGNDGSGSGLDADTLDGAQPNVSASNSTIVQRDSSGYIFANYFNTTADDVSSGVTKVMVETSNDNYIRHGDAAAVRSFLNVANGANNITNNNQISNGAGYITSAPTPKVNQVLSTTTTSTQYYQYYQGHIDTGLSLTINCADANNKIHIEYTIYGAATANSETTSSRPWGSRLLRNNSQIAGGTGGSAGNESAYSSTGDNFMDCHAFSYIDTPGAGNHTYKVQIRHHLGGSYGNRLTLNRDRSGSYRAASTLTCSEIVY